MAADTHEQTVVVHVTPGEILDQRWRIEQRLFFALVTLRQAQLAEGDHLAAAEVRRERLEHLAHAAVGEHARVYAQGRPRPQS